MMADVGGSGIIRVAKDQKVGHCPYQAKVCALTLGFHLLLVFPCFPCS